MLNDGSSDGASLTERQQKLANAVIAGLVGAKDTHQFTDGDILIALATAAADFSRQVGAEGTARSIFWARLGPISDAPTLSTPGSGGQ